MNLLIEYNLKRHIIEVRRINGVWRLAVLEESGAPAPGRSETALKSFFDPLMAKFFIGNPVGFRRYLHDAVDDKYYGMLIVGACSALRDACNGITPLEARKRLGLTQTALAEIVGVSDRHIRMIEAGDVHSLPYSLSLEALLRRDAAWFTLAGKTCSENASSFIQIQPRVLRDSILAANGMAVKAILSDH